MNAFPNIAEGEVSSMHFEHSNINVNLTDGSTISVPLNRYPRLQNATVEDLNDWQIIGHGYGIAWEKLTSIVVSMVSLPVEKAAKVRLRLRSGLQAENKSIIESNPS